MGLFHQFSIIEWLFCWGKFKSLKQSVQMHSKGFFCVEKCIGQNCFPLNLDFFLKVPTHEKDQIWKSCKKFVKSLWQKFVVNIKIETYFFPLTVFFIILQKMSHIFHHYTTEKTFLYSNLDNENMIQCMYFVKRFEIYVTLIIIHSKLFSFLSRPTYII